MCNGSSFFRSLCTFIELYSLGIRINVWLKLKLKLEPWSSTEASKQIHWREGNALTATYSVWVNELINTVNVTVIWPLAQHRLPSLLWVQLLMWLWQPTKTGVELVWTDQGYSSCLHLSSWSLSSLLYAIILHKYAAVSLVHSTGQVWQR